MSEQKPILIEGIPISALIDMKISGSFYSRLHQFLISYAQTKPIEEFTEIMNYLKVQGNEARNAYEFNLQTLQYLIHDLEQAARDQGKIEKKEFTPPTSTPS